MSPAHHGRGSALSGIRNGRNGIPVVSLGYFALLSVNDRLRMRQRIECAMFGHGKRQDDDNPAGQARKRVAKSANVFAAIASFRYAFRHAGRTGEMPEFTSLPLSLIVGRTRKGRSRKGARISEPNYMEIIARLREEILEACDDIAYLEPIRETVESDPDDERARRVEIYRERVQRTFDSGGAIAFPPEMGAKCGKGSGTVPVYCFEMKRWFGSTTEAVDYINGIRSDGKTGKPSHLRTAISRAKNRPAKYIGYTFSVSHPADGKPESRHVTAGERKRRKAMTNANVAA